MGSSLTQGSEGTPGDSFNSLAIIEMLERAFHVSLSNLRPRRSPVPVTKR